MTAKIEPREWVLWGFHLRYTGPLGVVPIKLSGGTLRQVRADRNRRDAEGGWTLGIYKSGDEPVGLREQCRVKHGTPA